ncbi:conserved Plasmodium protein, unknown function [Plasmodium vinckei vinckei]|uniref:Uncharacterized protein n=1 Tax=Plasmodium vinckei vinckei TaxID=54757 RepID=A0A449BWX5_PLAVN|nr:conserved Plasmodium protein, unknown function [Plasmodium vinckei vinckei]KEG03683.1 hypothetical protein YYE_01707 [Plasmodium vinckei vinckei]VEV57977.1 conserved Plasmodium protein, unknown function [Plasmodium vinckei vinckei]
MINKNGNKSSTPADIPDYNLNNKESIGKEYKNENLSNNMGSANDKNSLVYDNSYHNNSITNIKNDRYSSKLFISDNSTNGSISNKNSTDESCSQKCNYNIVVSSHNSDDSYKERTKYNKKKSFFTDYKGAPNNHPNYNNNKNRMFNETSNNIFSGYSNYEDKNSYNSSNTTHKETSYNISETNNSNSENRNLYQKGKTYINRNDNNKDYKYDNSVVLSGDSYNGTNYTYIPQKNRENKNDDENNLGNYKLNNNKICAEEKRPSNASEMYNLRDDERVNNLNTDDLKKNYIYKSLCMNREKTMGHTKIFDYVDYKSGDENNSISKHKNKTNEFIPKYKNLTPKEIHYNSLSGNDNITVLEANKIKLDMNRISNKNTDPLPDVYPFKLSKEYSKNEVKLEKLYPANYNYINNYNKNNANISIEERRNNMNSSHIFDYDYDDNKNNTKNGHYRNTNTVLPHIYNETKSNDKKNTEKDENRKKYPLYSDLFGRTTPNINQTIPCEKIMPTTMNSNWMYCPINSKKYSGESNKNLDYLKYSGKTNFHRKSYFHNDGYDCRKKFQEALGKGSKASFQVHLQSFINPDNNNDTDNYYNSTNYTNMEVACMHLENIKDSITDDEIKATIKQSGSYIVNYEPEFDIFSNKRKSNAKLCIRHPSGKDSLKILLNLFNELGIKVRILF